MRLSWRTALFFAAIFAITLALRLCHTHVLWSDEDYHLAAALSILRGKFLYRDLWYDKPPLAAWLYAMIGAQDGWPLRLFDAAYVFAVSAALWRFARDLWGRREAFYAAALGAFFLNFDFASAVIPIAPDQFLLLPHILAVYCAWKRRPLAAGLLCGIGALVHTKALFPLLVCASMTNIPLLLLGFCIPNAAALAYLAAGGALPDYFRQVWQWGLTYTRSSSEPSPLWNALRRSLDWTGFHAALAIGASVFWWKNRRQNLWLAIWIAASFVGVALGGRFFPRYFFLLLPPLVIVSARALAQYRPAAIVAAVALLVPLIRFAPRYFTVAQSPDIALDADSRAAAAIIPQNSSATLFVWGYRPGIYVYTHLPPDGRFGDSQPLTGVPADRHLHDSTPLIPEWAARNRTELAATAPTYIVDSLSLSNPQLNLEMYPELRTWLSNYRLLARTPLSLIYRREP